MFPTCSSVFLVGESSLIQELDAYGSLGLARYSCEGIIEAVNVPIIIRYYAVAYDAIPPGSIIRVHGTFAFKFPSVIVNVRAFDRVGGPPPPRELFVPRVYFEGIITSKVAYERVGDVYKFEFLCSMEGPMQLKFWCRLERDRIEAAKIPVLFEKHNVRIVGDIAGFRRQLVALRCVSFSSLLYPRDSIQSEPIYTPRVGVPELAMLGIFLPLNLRLDAARDTNTDPNEYLWATSVASDFIKADGSAGQDRVPTPILHGGEAITPTPARKASRRSKSKRKSAPTFSVPTPDVVGSRTPYTVYPSAGPLPPLTPYEDGAAGSALPSLPSLAALSLPLSPTNDIAGSSQLAEDGSTQLSSQPLPVPSLPYSPASAFSDIAGSSQFPDNDSLLLSPFQPRVPLPGILASGASDPIGSSQSLFSPSLLPFHRANSQPDFIPPVARARTPVSPALGFDVSGHNFTMTSPISPLPVAPSPPPSCVPLVSEFGLASLPFMNQDWSSILFPNQFSPSLDPNLATLAAGPTIPVATITAAPSMRAESPPIAVGPTGPASANDSPNLSDSDEIMSDVGPVISPDPGELFSDSEDASTSVDTTTGPGEDLAATQEELPDDFLAWAADTHAVSRTDVIADEDIDELMAALG